jgi:glycine/serine hydroxymethyltransferase
LQHTVGADFLQELESEKRVVNIDDESQTRGHSSGTWLIAPEGDWTLCLNVTPTSIECQVANACLSPKGEFERFQIDAPTPQALLYKKLNSAVFPGGQGGPLMHVIAGKAVALKEAMEPEFKTYQQQVAKNAKAMVEVFLERGYKVVSGGTDNHLFLVDLVDKNLTGKEADAALGRAKITVNKNSVPNDPKSPFVTSGIRVGTPAITRRGFKEAEAKELAGWMCDVLDSINDEAVIERIKGKVLDICARYPVYA